MWPLLSPSVPSALLFILSGKYLSLSYEKCLQNERKNTHAGRDKKKGCFGIDYPTQAHPHPVIPTLNPSPISSWDRDGWDTDPLPDSRCSCPSIRTNGRNCGLPHRSGFIPTQIVCNNCMWMCTDSPLLIIS